MLVSTKGRYALRVMLSLADNRDEYTSLKSIADSQEISLKYLESIASVLSKGGLIEGIHGKGGGYKLTKKPEEYTVWSILRLTEGGLSPVSCLECENNVCKRAAECKTLPMWTEFYNLTRDYFEKITIADLLKN